MANETTLSATLQNNKSGLAIVGSANCSITMAGANAIGNVQNIGATTEALSLGDVSTIGYLYLKNLDSTNFVEFDLNTPVVAGTAFCKLLPGEAAVIPTRRTTIYAKADTAAVDIHVVAVEL